MAEDEVTASSSCSECDCRAADLHCDAFSEFFLCAASALSMGCLQRQGARCLKQPLLLSQHCWSDTSVPVSVCRKFITAVALLPWLLFREATGPRSTQADGAVGVGAGMFHPFPPAKSCSLHLVPEEPSFPNFHAHQEQGNPVRGGGDGGEKAGGGSGLGLQHGRSSVLGD